MYDTDWPFNCKYTSLFVVIIKQWQENGVPIGLRIVYI